MSSDQRYHGPGQVFFSGEDGLRGERRILFNDRKASESSPSLRNFVEYFETGISSDHDPNAGPETAEARNARIKLNKAIVICLSFMVIELVGGYFAGSLAIMTDAAHLASDVTGFLVSLFALYLAERKPTVTLSYGFKRAEIIGAVISVVIIWFLTGILLWEAIQRTRGILNQTRDSVIDGRLMSGIAVFGLAANLTLFAILGHDHSHGGGHGHSHSSGPSHGHSHGTEKSKKEQNINVQAAYIHALGDLIQSVGVCISGIIIWIFPGTDPRYYMVQLADPICTFLFSILVLFSTYEVMKTSFVVLMEGVPTGISPPEIAAAIAQLPGVVGVHHLHVWAISVGEPSLSVHIVVSEGSDHETTLRRAQHIMRKFDISHTTIQIESVEPDVCKSGDCDGAPCGSYGLQCSDSGKCFNHENLDYYRSNEKSEYGSL